MTIQATDDLVIELWPPAPGNRADRPLLKLRSLTAERDGEDRAVIVYLPEVRHLVAALVEAAVELAEARLA
jgi:hypothetical protein